MIKSPMATENFFICEKCGKQTPESNHSKTCQCGSTEFRIIRKEDINAILLLLG